MSFRMAYDVICVKKYPLTLFVTNLRWHKMCKKDVVVIVTFDLIGLLPTNHMTPYQLQWHTGISEKTFDVNIKISQTMQNRWNFNARRRRNGKLQQLSGRCHTLIWRLGDTVENLESPGLSGKSWQHCKSQWKIKTSGNFDGAVDGRFHSKTRLRAIVY